MLVRTALFAVQACLVAPSPFEPHRLPAGGPWFEGWFARIVDPIAGRSVAVIVGSFMARGQRHLSSTWLAALVSHPNGSMSTEQHFPDQASIRITDRGQPVKREPMPGRPAIFEWSSELGSFRVEDANASMDFVLPSGLRLSASLRARQPWDPACPDACGPEGWARRLPSSLLPTHYFVHSLASEAEYHLSGTAGHGLAHQEMNWGAHFPDAWVWVQGVAQDGRTQLLLTGGDFAVAGINARSFIVAFHSQGRRWDFRNIDLDRISPDIDACGGRLFLSASSVDGCRHLAVNISAPRGSFSQPLYFPTVKGFSNTPGCVESYTATATVQLFEHGRPAGSAALEQVALEFGGRFRCPYSLTEAVPTAAAFV